MSEWILLRNIRAVDPNARGGGIDATVDVLVHEGRIELVEPRLKVPGLLETDGTVGAISGAEATQVLDCAGKVLVPGLVDVHVHFREPGYEHKETIETGARAAAHGGYTGVAPQANTKPVVDNGAAVSAILQKARGAACRIYPVGACTKGLGGSELAEMGDMVAAGARAFSDDGKGIQSAGMMRRVCDYAKMFNAAVMCHEQDESLVENGQVNEGAASTRLGLAPWPAQGEETMIARDIEICRLTGARVHFQHVTTARGVVLIRQAKEEGLPVTCEVTPHHLFLTEDDLTEDYDTNLKMNPPLRTKADARALADALIYGTADMISTDHAPHAAHEKSLEFEYAPFGTTGIECSLGLVLTHLVNPGRMTWQRLVQAMAIEPRKLLNLPQVKIEPGSVADLTIIDPQAEWVVTRGDFESKSDNCAFIGHILKGRATDVMVGGEWTMRDGEVVAGL